MSEMPNLKAKYREEVAPALMQKFHYKSTMQIPRIEKVVVNVAAAKPGTMPRCWTLWSVTWA